MYRTSLHVLLIIATCSPLILLVFSMLQRYPLDKDLTSIGIVDALLLVLAVGLPVFALPRLGVDWRSEPETSGGSSQEPAGTPEVADEEAPASERTDLYLAHNQGKPAGHEQNADAPGERLGRQAGMNLTADIHAQNHYRKRHRQ